MQVRLTALVNWRIWLVDWRAIEPYWAKSYQYQQLRKEKLGDAFLQNWFDYRKGVPKFNVGHLDYWPKEGLIMFGNGSHRTRLLARYLRYVPVSAHANCYRSRELGGHFKRLVSRHDMIEFPDLPVLSIAEIRRLKPSS